MTNRPVDTLIVGAGPVGLTMAAALIHQGLSCRIIDKVPAPSDKSKALVVWCRTLELLDGLDLATTFVDNGMKIQGGSIYAGGKRVLHLNLTSDESPFGFPLMIPQNVTERLLIEHLAGKGITVERQVELVTFVEKPDAVHCTLQHADGQQEEVQVPWLIGCDGAHSAVRHTLGMEFTGQAEPNEWMLADGQIEGSLATDEISVFWHESGVLVFFPISRDRFRMIADLGTVKDLPSKAEPTLADAQAKIDERGPGGLTLKDPNWLAHFRINERKVSDYRRGRVMLAGDAAHIHSPAGGQGMNTGMQDAFNLAWKMALVQRGDGQADPLLNSYSIERSAVGDRVLKDAERFTSLATLRGPIAQCLRNHLAPILGSFPIVQEKIRNDWFELSINYRHSPLSSENWPPMTGGLAAGDRLGDSPLESLSEARPATLFAAIRDTKHSLLLLPGSRDRDAVSKLLSIAAQATRVFPGIFSTHLILKPEDGASTPELPDVTVWVDLDRRLHQKLHANDRTLFLVRPDGYVAYRCQPADGERLMNYLGCFVVSKGK